jgi:hypothetical protein
MENILMLELVQTRRKSFWGVGETKETINCFIQNTIILNVNPNANISY